MATIKQPLRATYLRESLLALRDIYSTEAEFIAFWELYGLRERYKLSSMRYHSIWMVNPVLHLSVQANGCHRPDLTHVWWYFDKSQNIWSAVFAGLGAIESECQSYSRLEVLRFHGLDNTDKGKLELCGLALIADTELMPQQTNGLGTLTVPLHMEDEMSVAVTRHINIKEMEIRSKSLKHSPSM